MRAARSLTPRPPVSPLVESLALLRRRWFGPLAVALFLLLLLHLFILITISIPARIDITYPEGSLVDRALAVARGEVPYLDWRRWPHVFAPYAPLTYYPVGWTARLADPAHQPWTVYLLGRAQSWLALAGIGVLIFLIARALGLSRLLSLAAVGALGFWTALISYGVSYRPDAPAAALALLALYCIVRGPARPLGIAAALVALGLSFWFKPTALGMLPIMAVWIYRSAGFIRTAGYLSTFAASGLIPLVLLDHRWHGTLFENLIAFNAAAGFSSHYLADYFGSVHPSLIVMLAGTVVAFFDLRSAASRELRYAAAAALASLAVALLQCAKVGADQNYFLVPYALLTLLLFHAALDLWNGKTASLAPPAREALLWLAILPCVLGLQILILSGARKEYAQHVRNWRTLELERIARGWNGPILSPSPFFQVIAASPPSILDPYAYTALVQKGKIDPAILRERVARRAFAAILLPAPPSALQSIIDPPLANDYDPRGRLASFMLYLPKEPAPHE